GAAKETFFWARRSIEPLRFAIEARNAGCGGLSLVRFFDNSVMASDKGFRSFSMDESSILGGTDKASFWSKSRSVELIAKGSEVFVKLTWPPGRSVTVP